MPPFLPMKRSVKPKIGLTRLSKWSVWPMNSSFKTKKRSRRPEISSRRPKTLFKANEKIIEGWQIKLLNKTEELNMRLGGLVHLVEDYSAFHQGDSVASSNLITPTESSDMKARWIDK